MNCSNWSIECVFPPSRRTCHRRPKASALQRPKDAGCRHPRERQAETRLRTIEGMLQQLMTDADSHSPSLLQGRREPCEPTGDATWTPETVARRLEETLASLCRTIAFSAGRSAQHPVITGDFTPSPFPFDTFSLDVASFHPPPTQIQTCWQLFLRNIDPLAKVLHQASTEKTLVKAINDPTALEKGESAVVFAVYLSSLSNMSATDAESFFGAPKHTALAVYREATEHALMKANLLATEDLTTLQGFVLFLSFNRFTDDARRVWVLTGLANRLSSAVKASTTSPFEREMRKRLRWKLWYLDYRAHEDLGQGVVPPDVAELPELPVNAADVDMDPAMTETPEPRHGWTAISFSLVQFEIACTARVVRAISQPQDKEDTISACERRIQSTYLRHCDGTKPIHWLAQHVAHVLIMELRFRLHHQQYISPAGHSALMAHTSFQDQLFLTAVDILDTQRRIEMEPQAAHWSWLLVAYKQFWPLSFVLGELCCRQRSEAVDRAWEVAKGAFGRWKTDDKSTARAETLSRLLARAQAARNDTMVLGQHFSWLDSFAAQDEINNVMSWSAPGLTDIAVEGARSQPGEAAISSFLDHNLTSLAEVPIQSRWGGDSTSEGPPNNHFEDFVHAEVFQFQPSGGSV